MDYSQLLNMSKVTRAADAQDGAARTTVKRTVNRFTEVELDWLRVNHAEYTAAEAGAHLGRPGAVCRKKCLHMGIQLKYEECKNSNHRKPGLQKELAKAV